MAKTYNNVPMSEADQDRVKRQDAAWTGPKLIILCGLTLGIALFILYSAATGLIGPVVNQ